MAHIPRSAVGSPSAGDAYLPTNGNGGYRVEHYDLDLDYRVMTNHLSAVATITARTTQRLDGFSLDLAGLSIDKVTVDGERPKKVTHAARKLVIALEHTLETGTEFTVVVRYRGTPHPVRSPWGELGWEELADGVLVASQPSGAPSWFPCNDHPGNKASYRISVSCESSYTVVSNGQLLSKTARSGRTRWVYEVTEPMATYLATLQIGPYRSREVRGTTPHTQIFYPASLDRNATVDFARLKDMLALFEAVFGPYPFGGYSVVVTPDELEIPLEAHGLAIFGSNHVDGSHGSDRLIAHELAHQWFGNSLTVGGWRDIWLHEGFACYAEWLWSEETGGESAQENAERHWQVIDDQPKDLIVGDPGAELMFDDRVYKRGALALHVLRMTIGDEAFFGALTAWTVENRFGTVTTEQFAAFLEEHTGSTAVAGIIRRWIYSKRLPPLPEGH